MVEFLILGATTQIADIMAMSGVWLLIGAIIVIAGSISATLVPDRENGTGLRPVIVLGVVFVASFVVIGSH